MAEARRFVVDASVAAKWHLRDEEFVEPSIALLEDFREGRVHLSAPDHIRHEVASAILKTTRREQRRARLPVDVGRRAIEVLLSWGLELERSDNLVPYAYSLASRLGCSFYVGLYLALAESTRAPLIYADNKLKNALADRFAFAVWIEDYQPG